MTEARALRTLTQIGRILRLCELGEVHAVSAVRQVAVIAMVEYVTEPKTDAKATQAPAAKDAKMPELERRRTDENGHWMAKANADEDWEDWTDPPH